MKRKYKVKKVKVFIGMNLLVGSFINTFNKLKMLYIYNFTYNNVHKQMFNIFIFKHFVNSKH